MTRPKAPIGQMKTMLGYVRPYRLQVICVFVAILFTSSSVLGMGSALRYLIDHGLSEGNQHILDRAFIIFLGVVALLSVATYARYYLVSWIGERVIADIRRDVYTKLIHMQVGFFETTSTGELLSRMSTDTTLLQTVIGSSISLALRNALLFIGGCILLLVTSIKLTAYIFLMLPLTVMPILWFGRQVRGMSRAAQDRVAALNSHAEETLNAIRTIQALAMSETEEKLFAGKVSAAFLTATSRIRARAMLTALVIMLVFGAVAVVLWIGGRQVLAGLITPGDLSAFVFYSVVMAGAVGAISEVITDLQRAAGAAERLRELLLLNPNITSPEHPVEIPEHTPVAVTFENVSFVYPARKNHSALSELNLEIKEGETVALVGPSGAGKTTLFNLLLRLYDPDSGVVRVHGVDVREANIKRLRHVIGIVQQDPVIFSGTAMDNIRYGLPHATEAEVVDAARAASALEFIDRLPERFDTQLGERGVQLSGGQKQRIAIARAIIRNPRILLLDEATSALDAENERLVQDALAKLMQERTTLVIAHRLSTVINADRILLMEQGKLVATGTHAQLLEKSPLYARLAALQLSH